MANSLVFGAAHFGWHAINVSAKFFYNPRQCDTVQKSGVTLLVVIKDNTGYTIGLGHSRLVEKTLVGI